MRSILFGLVGFLFSIAIVLFYSFAGYGVVALATAVMVVGALYTDRKYFKEI